MITTIVSLTLFTIVFVITLLTLGLLEYKIIELINLSRNPNRNYHLIAFFGVLLGIVLIAVKYIDILVRLFKISDL